MDNTKLEDIKINIECECPICHKIYYISLPSRLYERVMTRNVTGEYIQDILKDYSASTREALLTGICDECYDGVFEDLESIEDD